MSEHTPGPWEWRKDDLFDYWNLKGANGSEVCDDGSAGSEYSRVIDPEGDGTNRANARLIAAAPCLLSALQAIVKELGFIIADEYATEEEILAIQQAKTAIAKATGAANDP